MNRYAQRVDELTDSDAKESNAKRLKTLTEEELQAVEREIGHVLPPDYREFLRDYGGMTFSVNRCRRAALYHLNNCQGGRASIYDVLDNIALIEVGKGPKGYAPDELLFFGENGNVQLFIAVDGDHVGSIYQFYPSYFPENLHYYPELELVSRSFDEFIHSLKPLEEEFYEDDSYYEEENRESKSAVEKLSLINLRPDSCYSQVLSELNSRFVYSTLGEDSKVLSDREIDDIEQDIGYLLPEDYKEFLRFFGGYSFMPAVSDNIYDYSIPSTYPLYPIVTDKYPGLRGIDLPITFFHGHMPNDYHDLARHNRRLNDFLPSGFSPIADAGEICLVIFGEHAGYVYKAPRSITDYPHSNSSERLEISSLDFVAASFDEFIRSIRLNGDSRNII